MFQSNLCEDALAGYGKRLDEARELGARGLPDLRAAAPPAAGAPPAAAAPSEGAREALAKQLGSTLTTEEPVCLHCRGSFQLGETLFTTSIGNGKHGYFHRGCLARSVAKDMEGAELDRLNDVKSVNLERRQAFSIGWSAEAIPSNAASLQKLGCGAAPRGMCCLVAGEGGALTVAATLEPSAALNLEYLSISLKVRRTEGREPLFSLDPVFGEGNKIDDQMQLKRFEPEWLAGTSVGEVMFQADYYLKELSFGEYDQPVLGMRSAFELSEDDGPESEWSAREWFVVRKAEVHASEDQVLIPHLRMGVEAREQVRTASGLEDARISRPDHPCVVYAEAFTDNFDLIAERKSVVFQLREVAKASIMAKYLMESGADLGEAWFGLADENASAAACCMEVPQLWHVREKAWVQVENDQVMVPCSSMHGLYGGVDFGINRFRLSTPSRLSTSVTAGRAVLGRPASSLMATRSAGLTTGPARQFARLSQPLASTMSAAASRAGLGVPRVSAGLTMGKPQGVDLDLNTFNLSAVTASSGRYGGAVQASDGAAHIGSSFWAGLEGSGGMCEEDKKLLRDVFNARLSDRRADGEAFVPPPTDAMHLGRLRQLVKGEQVVRQRRREQFFSGTFDATNSGPLFPSSWRSSVMVEAAAPVVKRAARPDFAAQADLLREALTAATTSFDKTAEDGCRFRIYRVGGVEARTVQDLDGEEIIGAVFSIE